MSSTRLLIDSYKLFLALLPSPSLVAWKFGGGGGGGEGKGEPHTFLTWVMEKMAGRKGLTVWVW